MKNDISVQGSKTLENIYIKKHLIGNGLKGKEKKIGICKIEDFMVKKIPLEAKIAIRNKETISNSELWKKIRLLSRDQNMKEIRQKSNSCYYNHLSPNRDFQGFDYLFKPRIFNKKLRKYYHNIIFDNI